MQSIQIQPVKKTELNLIREMRGGELYEYYPLGKYVVAAPDVCGGRPTFKYTRLEVSVALSLIAKGGTIKEVAREYSHSHLTPEAVQEALRLAEQALVQSTTSLLPIAV